MQNLNYFFPYDKGTNNHEDHLTRAFLVILKYSSAALKSFYTYIKEQSDCSELRPLHKLELNNINFKTQVGSLPNSDIYASILITNEIIEINKEIKPSDRKAIYDGVIDFNNELVLFIETKPNKKYVWEEQLCPSKKDIPEESFLINKPIVLEWKEIINILHNINESAITLPHEKLIISDFFDLVNTHFDYLNPYNDFSKCHSNYLIGKRIEQVLKEISKNPDNVKIHIGWARYIELELKEIKKIALIDVYNKDGEWNGLIIATDFGSTVSQARHFFSKIDTINNKEGWHIKPNFHLAFTTKNLVFFNSSNLENYFNYYADKKNIWNKIKQIPKDKLQEWLNDLASSDIINYPLEKRQEVQSKIMDKGYTTINICPAIYMEYYISKDKAIELDKKDLLVPMIKNKMEEILSIVENNFSF